MQFQIGIQAEYFPPAALSHGNDMVSSQKQPDISARGCIGADMLFKVPMRQRNTIQKIQLE